MDELFFEKLINIRDIFREDCFGFLLFLDDKKYVLLMDILEVEYLSFLLSVNGRKFVIIIIEVLNFNFEN